VTLDLAAAARQLRAAQPLLHRAEARRRARQEAAAAALALVRQQPERLDVRRPHLHLPGVVELPLDRREPAPATPLPYGVVATDGSQIAPDPHGILLYAVVNVGRVALHYGEPAAHLDSRATFTCDEDDLFVHVGGRRELVDEHVLATQRKVAELRELAAFAEEQQRGQPLLALQDGSLILTEHESVARAGSLVIEGDERRPRLLHQYVTALETLVQRRIVVAGFISRPRSDLVARLLRAAVCPHDDATWRAGCQVEPDALCARLAGASDRDVVAAIGLEPGERSVRFRSRWREVRAGEPGVEIDFFFFHTGSEIARVQLPATQADDPQLLAFCHAALADQCRRGDGYPPALAEAHEQAVISASDRRAFAALVERQLVQLGLSVAPSAKQRAKERRAL
jgi:hypothetical protein